MCRGILGVRSGQKGGLLSQPSKSRSADGTEELRSAVAGGSLPRPYEKDRERASPDVRKVLHCRKQYPRRLETNEQAGRQHRHPWHLLSHVSMHQKPLTSSSSESQTPMPSRTAQRNSVKPACQIYGAHGPWSTSSRCHVTPHASRFLDDVRNAVAQARNPSFCSDLRRNDPLGSFYTARLPVDPNSGEP